MKILGIHDDSACGYYRIQLPLSRMHEHGYQVRYGTKGITQEGEVLVVQRAGMARSTRGSWLELWKRGPIVWECDDDLWAIDKTNTRAHDAYTPQALTEIESGIRLARAVTVSTEPLAEVVREFNPNVHVLPNCIDAGLFEIERPRRDRVTVGWAGGDSHRRDWEMVAPRIRRFAERNPDVDIHTIGQDPASWGLKFRHRHTGWAPDIFDYYGSIDFDIGLAPLIPSRFNRSKSAIKALEYAALGIPVIASDLDPYRAFVIDGVTGFLVNRDHEWEARLSDLVNDAELREQMGKAAKEHARKWSIEDRWKDWADVYSSVAP